MAADSLQALGLELRAEAVAWLAALTPDALPDGTAAARELFTALGALEAEVAGAAADEVELTRLQAWLTAGFFAAPEPFAPADVVVEEVMEEARRGEAEGSAAAGSAGTGSAPVGSMGSTEPAARAGGGPGGANEFAAGSSQSPPSRTPDREITTSSQPRRGLFGNDDAFQAENEKQQPAARVVEPSTVPSRAKQPPPSELFGNDPFGRAAGSAESPASSLPRPTGGIQGLGALAALAGRGGVDLPAPDEERRIASDRAAWEPKPANAARPRTAESVDGEHADADDQPRRAASSAERGVEPAGGREVDRDAVRPPPRVIRIPFTTPVTEDADDGWAAAPPLPIPFLTAPGEVEQDEVSGGSLPASDARQAIGIPTMRVFDPVATQLTPTPTPTPDARRADAEEWAGFAAPAESTESFLARAASLVGARVRPAAEVVAGPAATVPAPREEPAPAIQPLAKLAAAEPEVTPTVLAREVVAPRPPEVMEWPAPDVTDLLDALASEIAHEYRRYYGE